MTRFGEVPPRLPAVYPGQPRSESEYRESGPLTCRLDMLLETAAVLHLPQQLARPTFGSQAHFGCGVLGA